MDGLINKIVEATKNISFSKKNELELKNRNKSVNNVILYLILQ